MNDAQKLQQALGVQSKEKRIQEMAGAVTRLVINEAIKEAKESGSFNWFSPKGTNF